MTQAAGKRAHNMKLYIELVRVISALPISIKEGKMFGCPALYVGRKMALCIDADCIGMRVPEDIAVKAKSLHRAVPFTPYGKKPMREWIAIEPTDDLNEFEDLFLAALSFAEQNNDKS
jgi:hypothetical protein